MGALINLCVHVYNYYTYVRMYVCTRVSKNFFQIKRLASINFYITASEPLITKHMASNVHED